MSKCKSCGHSFKDEIKMVHDQDECTLAMKEDRKKKKISKDERIKKLVKENKRLQRKIKELEEMKEDWVEGIKDMIESD